MTLVASSKKRYRFLKLLLLCEAFIYWLPKYQIIFCCGVKNLKQR